MMRRGVTSTRALGKWSGSDYLLFAGVPWTVRYVQGAPSRPEPPPRGAAGVSSTNIADKVLGPFNPPPVAPLGPYGVGATEVMGFAASVALMPTLRSVRSTISGATLTSSNA
ncbi:hypothetical protein AaE_013527 [Aphanomyces astaci]|uniref:Uncharacterized protein n=1 Tax=Aphanomyces astaci TaxID=112090 RepID=A0A6A4Z9M7_APHAT|nr:hypothetical protein AaE_013527 [Aphanomyces astaci]